MPCLAGHMGTIHDYGLYIDKAHNALKRFRANAFESRRKISWKLKAFRWCNYHFRFDDVHETGVSASLWRYSGNG